MTSLRSCEMTVHDITTGEDVEAFVTFYFNRGYSGDEYEAPENPYVDIQDIFYGGESIIGNCIPSDVRGLEDTILADYIGEDEKYVAGVF